MTIKLHHSSKEIPHKVKKSNKYTTKYKSLLRRFRGLQSLDQKVYFIFFKNLITNKTSTSFRSLLSTNTKDLNRIK